MLSEHHKRHLAREAYVSGDKQGGDLTWDRLRDVRRCSGGRELCHEVFAELRGDNRLNRTSLQHHQANVSDLKLIAMLISDADHEKVLNLTK